MLQSSISPVPSEMGQTRARRTSTVVRLIGFTAVALFVTTEILVLFGAATWAVSGLAHLGPVSTGVVATVLGIPSLLAIAKCVQLAFLAEMGPEVD